MVKEIKRCEICDKEIEIKKERVISNNGKSNSSTLLYSDDGVYYEEGRCWFCSEHWEELFNNAGVDYIKLLKEEE